MTNKEQTKSSSKGQFKLTAYGTNFSVMFDKEKRAVVAWRVNCPANKGVAKCNKSDKFSVKYGANLAIKRALSKYYGNKISTHIQKVITFKSAHANIKKSINTKLDKILPGIRTENKLK